ncbi:MAG: GIY-YIG nuclease family protein [bacterium]
MYCVYVLHSVQYDKIYIGCTSDLTQRLLSHNKLATRGWTIRYRPWKLIHVEEYPDKARAFNREKQLKSHQGREFIRKELL